MSAAQSRAEGYSLRGFPKPWSRPDYDNSGDGPLRVPGFGGLPVDIEHKPEERFACGSHDWAQPRLTAREMTMLRVMNDVTDVSGWQDMLDDEAILGELRPSQYVAPLLSELAWQWCVRELRDMAKSLRDAGHVRVFASASCAVKCDLLQNESLLVACQQQLKPLVREALQTQPFLDDLGLAELHEDTVEAGRLFQKKSPVLQLVDPALYPLVYGRTRVLKHGGRVDLGSTLDFKNWGETSDIHDRGLDDPAELFKFNDDDGIDFPFNRRHDARLYRASDRFQWLPCEMKFSKEPNKSDVRITSYINNLHPIKHRVSNYGISQALQILGRVDIPQGRSLTIPANIQREVAAPVELLDKARPGHVRLIQLYLVDPHYRICSTRNVPPQQRHWWQQAAGLNDVDWAKTGLPQEIVDHIVDNVDNADWPMGMVEAAKHRAHRLAEELVARHAANEGVERYMFNAD